MTKDLATTASPESSSESAAPKGSHCTVPESTVALLACRSAGDLMWGERWLREFGFDVATARDRHEIRSALEWVRPAVVICDSNLLTTSGSDLIRALGGSDEYSDVPILAVCTRDRQTRFCTQIGVSDILRRPIDWRIGARRAAVLANSAAARRELLRTRAELDQLKAKTALTEATRESAEGMDRLTGLPSRERFLRILDSELSRGVNHAGRTAVFFLDLDRFGRINKVCGREAGNAVLNEVAERIERGLRDFDSIFASRAGSATAAIGRPSGDEFTVLLSTLPDADTAKQIADRLIRVVSEPFDTSVGDVYLSASVGIALTPDDGSSGDELLASAETAMLQAKELGGGTAVFHGHSPAPSTARRMTIERELRKALDAGQLTLSYQPLVLAEDQSIMGVEALLRWTHEELGSISPSEFIPVAEESNLIIPLGEWVLRTACAQLRAWLDQGLPPVRMAVNIALAQLRKSNLVELVREVLEEYDLDPSLLELELSERGFLGDNPGPIKQLTDLRAMDVRISLDDFGTGQSAIAYLRSLPLDVLKIDRSFVSGATHNSSDAAIASAMVAMGQRLQLEIIAEGVETEAQLDLLREWGCPGTQGFLFSPAVPADAMTGLLTDGLRAAC